MTKRTWLIICSGLLLTAFFYMMAVTGRQNLSICQHRAVILKTGNPWSAEEIRLVQKTEEDAELPRDFTAWGQEDNVMVQNMELSRNCEADILKIQGRSDLLLNGSTWLDEEDTMGCMIDEKTAVQLFGSTAVNGLQIIISGKEKMIRGILYDVDNTIVCQADSEDGQNLNYLTVAMRTGESYENIRQDFMVRHGIDGNILRMDILYQAAGVLCLFIPGIFLWYVFLILRHYAGACCREKDRIWYQTAAFFSLSVFIGYLVVNAEIPLDMIPTKWSDFDFWSRWWENEKESFLLLLLTEKKKPHQLYLKEFYQAGKYCSLGVLSVIIVMSRLKNDCQK